MAQLSRAQQIAALVRNEFRTLDARELLRQPTSVLLGVDDGVEAALAKLDIASVFDLATSKVFDDAAKLTAAGTDSRAAMSQHGVPPADLVREGQMQGHALNELQFRPIGILQTVPETEADAIAAALDTAVVRDLSLFPPYRAATFILESVYFPENQPEFDPDTPSDLIPKSGEYPTERVQYTTLLMDEIRLGPNDALVDLASEAFTPISIDKLTQLNAGFKHVAYGALLTFNQSWYAQAVTLGQLLHSTALAPGESTRIAVIDWSRKSRAGQTEVIQETDDLTSDTSHNRSISEVTSAVADEAQGGFSATNTSSKSSQSGEAGSLDISAPLGGLFGGPSGSAAFSSSRASNESSAESYSSSWGHREIGSTMMQDVNDRTHQHAHSSRSRRASVVKEVAQSEHEQVSTRVLTNYNHMHALTVQYYEVVQIYRVEVMLRRADRVVFIPLQLVDFNKDDVVRSFRPALARAALAPDIRDALRNLDVIEVSPDRTAKFSALDKNLNIFLREAVSKPRVTLKAAALKPVALAIAGDDEKPAAEEAKLAAAPLQIRASAYIPAVQLANDHLWASDQVARLAGLLDRSVLRPDSNAIYLPADVLVENATVSGDAALKPVFYKRAGGRVEVTPQAPVALMDIVRIAISGSNASNEVSGATTLTLNRNGVRFPFELPAVKIPAGTSGETRLVQLSTGGVNTNLKQHLNANKLHYSQAVFRSLDSTQLATLLSGFGVQAGDRLVPVSQLIDPRPIRFIGNFLAFRMNSDSQHDASWQKWLEERGIRIGSIRSDIVPLGTGGTFAEAVLGRFNCAEKLDITRFWNWQDSPIPIQPPEIAAIQTGSRQAPEDVKPGQLSNPIISITQPTSLPDPVGTAAALAAIQNGNMFRDMSGLQATIGLAQAGLQASAAGAAAAAQQAGVNQQNQLQATTERQRIAADMIKDLARTAASVYTGGMAGGGGGGGGPAASSHSQDGAKINYFDKTKQPAPPAQSNGAGNGTVNAVEGGGSSGGGESMPMSNGMMAFSDSMPGSSWQYSQNPGILAANWGGMGTSGQNFINAAYEQAGDALKGGGGTPPSPANGEVNLAGYFVWDPKLDDAQEIQQRANNKWSPATVDFLAVMGSNTNNGMGNFEAIMGELVKYAPRSIKRVNFMTHADSDTVGIMGRNTTDGDVIFDVSVTKQDIDGYAASGLSFTYGNKTYTLDDVRDRFAKDAVFVLYGCKAGQSTGLLTALNKLLGVRIVGFKQKIAFCYPAPQNGSIVRKGTKIGIYKSGFSCSTDSVTDWKGLITHADAVSVP